jgi:hypothetical protein
MKTIEQVVDDAKKGILNSHWGSKRLVFKKDLLKKRKAEKKARKAGRRK